VKLLHIDSSILGEHSASRELGAVWVAAWQQQHPAGEVHHVDLAREPLAHLSGEIFAARSAPVLAHDATLQSDIAADQAALNTFVAADVVVIGAPMYNFSIPSQLKAWIDRIVVAGQTFRYGANGPQGLAQGKKVVILVSRGGIYSAGPAAAMDFQETYLRSVFGFIGITDVTIIRAEGLSMGADKRAEAMTVARGLIEAPVALAA
jgi:FMN-dependent NADH-azoreductase